MLRLFIAREISGFVCARHCSACCFEIQREERVGPHQSDYQKMSRFTSESHVPKPTAWTRDYSDGE